MEIKNAFIDTFCFSLPAEMVTIPPDLEGKIIELDDQTGEILKEKRKSGEYYHNGARVYVRQYTLVGKNRIVFFASRKLMPAVYYLQRYNDETSIISDSEYLLLSSIEFYKKSGFDFPDLQTLKDNIHINDVDFTVDFIETSYFFNGRLDWFNIQNPTGRLFYETYEHNFLKKKVKVGLEFARRKEAKITTPYVKFYSKHLELTNEKNKDFYFHLLDNKVLIHPDLRRIECTGKNRLHLDSIFKIALKEEKFTVRKFLKLEEFEIKKVVHHLASRHLDLSATPTIKQKSKSETTPLDFVLGEMSYHLLKQGFTVKNLTELIENGNFSANAKSRISRKIKDGILRKQKSERIQNLKITPLDAFLI